jgi:glycerophosphoryl diester phosphodiesterase
MRLLFFLLPAMLLISCSGPRNATKDSMTFANNCVIAHRGAWKQNNFPQNSIASLKHAISLQCAGSEFDVRMTADDSLIINHDPTYHDLEIEKTSFKELSQFKLSNGETLPTLRQYIQAGMQNNYHTRLVCEIKPSEISKERGRLVALKVMNLVNEMQAGKFLVYISFDYEILKKILEINPHAATQYLEGDKSPQQLKTDGISGADFHYSVYDDHPDWIEIARKNGIALNVWTINDTALIDRFLKNKFDFITTNEPELVFERIRNH